MNTISFKHILLQDAPTIHEMLEVKYDGDYNKIMNWLVLHIQIAKSNKYDSRVEKLEMIVNFIEQEMVN